jgi:chromosome segregation ATPase
MLTQEQLQIMDDLQYLNEQLEEDLNYEQYDEEIDDLKREIAEVEKKRASIKKDRKKIEAKIEKAQEKLARSFGAIKQKQDKKNNSLHIPKGRKFRAEEAV